MQCTKNFLSEFEQARERLSEVKREFKRVLLASFSIFPSNPGVLYTRGPASPYRLPAILFHDVSQPPCADPKIQQVARQR